MTESFLQAECGSSFRDGLGSDDDFGIIFENILPADFHGMWYA